MVAVSLAINVHLALILYSMCHGPVLCTGRQNTYPVSSVMEKKKKRKRQKHFCHWWTNTFLLNCTYCE